MRTGDVDVGSSVGVSARVRLNVETAVTVRFRSAICTSYQIIARHIRVSNDIACSDEQRTTLGTRHPPQPLSPTRQQYPNLHNNDSVLVPVLALNKGKRLALMMVEIKEAHDDFSAVAAAGSGASSGRCASMMSFLIRRSSSSPDWCTVGVDGEVAWCGVVWR